MDVSKFGNGGAAPGGFSGQAFGIYLGEVTAVDDDGIFIKAKVPSLLGDNTETGWAAPMSLFGGLDSGMFFPPDIGDPCQVMFQNGDVNAPLYFGGRWDNEATPPEEGGKTKRIIKTKGGQYILFDDENNTIKIVSPNGTYILTEDNKVTTKVPDGSIVEVDGESMKGQAPSGAAFEIGEGKATVTGPGGSCKVEMTSAKATVSDAGGASVELNAGVATIAGASAASIGAGGAGLSASAGAVTVEAGGAKLEAGPGGAALSSGGTQLMVSGGQILLGAGGKKLVTDAFWGPYNNHQHMFPGVPPGSYGVTQGVKVGGKLLVAHFTSVVRGA